MTPYEEGMDTERDLDRCEIEPPYPFGSMYTDYVSKCRREPEGHAFHDPAVLRNVAPSTTTVTKTSWWRRLTRSRRLAAGLRLRDALVEAILSIGRRHASPPGRPARDEAADAPVVVPPEASGP